MKKLIFIILGMLAISCTNAEDSIHVKNLDIKNGGNIRLICIHSVEYIEDAGYGYSYAPMLIIAVDKNGKPKECNY